ncbi:hypothetical protein [Alkalinema sp. FACHB-956]|uniref:hypothetical protein n=1 Tax=Alkalinema sp. FACHB-956 TaxID=2692768 RepID=UPI00168807E0|nr:hypothetical protein [Alkalinema sp. FACHB-956]MBD2326577.1 hypothetical protein [Alkalinema sp. FACHB-956]
MLTSTISNIDKIGNIDNIDSIGTTKLTALAQRICHGSATDLHKLFCFQEPWMYPV